MLDTWISVATALLTIVLAYLGLRVTIHPPNEDRAKQRGYKIAFWVCGSAALVLVAWAGVRNSQTQAELKNLLGRIEQNTTTPPKIEVNIPPTPPPPTPIPAPAPYLTGTAVPIGGSPVEVGKKPSVGIRWKIHSDTNSFVGSIQPHSEAAFVASCTDDTALKQVVSNFKQAYAARLKSRPVKEMQAIFPDQGLLIPAVWNSEPLTTDDFAKLNAGDSHIAIVGAIRFKDRGGALHEAHYCGCVRTIAISVQTDARGQRDAMLEAGSCPVYMTQVDLK